MFPEKEKFQKKEFPRMENVSDFEMYIDFLDKKYYNGDNASECARNMRNPGRVNRLRAFICE